MLIGIASGPCSLSLRNRSRLCSATKCHQNKSDLKNVFVQKSFFFNIYSFNPNHAYWNQRRLFSGNLPGMFINCSWTKFIANIVNVFVFFMQNFRLTILTFRVTFSPWLFAFSWSKILSQSQFQAAEFNWRQFNTKSQMKIAPKLVPFFTLNLKSGIC